jgi:type IV pilus assembly protein PilM
LSSAASQAAYESQFYKIGLVRGIERWLYAMPHPSLVVEIAPHHVAAARWGTSRGRLESAAVEALPAGSVTPSPVETNITQPEAVRAALRRVFNRVPVNGSSLALLVPDSVVRVFIMPFESLPRRASEALPLLRWRLKKSVPFDVDETVLSWSRQSGRAGGLEIIASIARQRIVREYEEIVESLGARAGMVLSSSLAALPLLPERGAAMLIRLGGKTLTTAITHGATLCLFRTTELPVEAELLETQGMLEEVFPAVAYHQDVWGGTIDRAFLAGFGAREEQFRSALESELKTGAASMTEAEGAHALDEQGRDLVRHGLDSLAGWAMNAGS